jgi:hypothetical protein
MAQECLLSPVRPGLLGWKEEQNLRCNILSIRVFFVASCSTQFQHLAFSENEFEVGMKRKYARNL